MAGAFAHSLDGAGSPPVSPWGSTCSDWPDREWFADHFLLQTNPNQDPNPKFYAEGNYPVGSPPGWAWFMWSAACSDEEEAMLVGAMRILQSADSLQILAGIKLMVPTLVAAFDSAILWITENTRDEILLGRNPTETSKRNPFWSVAYGDEAGVVGLVTTGVDSPGTFTFPLVWEKAMEIPTTTGGTETLSLGRLSDLLQEQAERDGTWNEGESQTLEDTLLVLAAGIRTITWDEPAALGVLPEVLSIVGTVWDVLVIGFNPIFKIVAFDLEVSLQLGLDRFSVGLLQALVEPNLASSAAAALGGFVGILDDVADTVDDKLLPIAALIDPFSSSASRTLEGIGDSIRGAEEAALFGLSEKLAARLIDSLDSGGSSTVPAVIHFSSSCFDWYFDDFQPGYFGPGAFPDSEHTADYAKPIGQAWMSRASPSLQYAFALDLAAKVLQQVLNANSLLMALSDLVTVEGPLGTTFRGVLGGLGLSCVEDMLDGHALSWFVAQLWKQAMVDRLLYKWGLEHPDDLDCLYEVFCWMREPEARARLDEVLGPVGAEGTRSYTLLSEMFSEGTAGVCAYWDALPCDTREDLHQVLSDWDCLSTLFEEVAEPPEEWSIEHADLDLGEVYTPYAVEYANLQFSKVRKNQVAEGATFDAAAIPSLPDWVPNLDREEWGIELDREQWGIELDREEWALPETLFRVPDLFRTATFRW